MKLSSSIRLDSLIMPIFFIFFYDHRSASGSISGPEIAYPAICTGASGDLYWHQGGGRDQARYEAHECRGWRQRRSPVALRRRVDRRGLGWWAGWLGKRPVGLGRGVGQRQKKSLAQRRWVGWRQSSRCSQAEAGQEGGGGTQKELHNANLISGKKRRSTSSFDGQGWLFCAFFKAKKLWEVNFSSHRQ